MFAAERGLLRGAGTGLTSVAAADGGSVRAANFVSGAQGGIPLDRFASQAITAFGFNDRRRTVFVYTAKPMSARDRKQLPTELPGGLSVEYKPLKPLSIGREVLPALFGGSPLTRTGAGAYACGSSISPANNRNAGTFGALVAPNNGSGLFGLTNNHVTGGCNNSRVGLPVSGPGILDVMAGGLDPMVIGHHHAVIPMRQGEPSVVDHRQNTDAALFRIGDPSRVTSMQGSFYDTPTEVADAEEDFDVEKVGRTTGHTKGRIEAQIAGAFPVGYNDVTYHGPEEEVHFSGLVYFEPVFLIRGHGGPFSLPGDSGSLVVTGEADERKAIGLVFAGRAPNESYMIPLRPILERFDVGLVSRHNVV